VFGINDCMGRIRDLDFEAFQHFASILPAQSYPVPPHLDQ
jgi:hypothetical protein